MKEVKIVYCMSCGYLKFAANLKNKIEKIMPGAKVKLEGGQKGVLDVFVDKKLIFSKWKEGRLPEDKEVLEELK